MPKGLALSTAKVLGGDIRQIKELVTQHEVNKVVVGLPLNMDGSAGPRAEKARAFARRLGQVLGLPVELWDERLTTVEAERLLIQADMRRAGLPPGY
ncbi:MAG: Holliday junction resolvase RuvX [Candidatus Syntrophopropionicum ammoniitolerans]